jgi:hypothetical protein
MLRSLLPVGVLATFALGGTTSPPVNAADTPLCSMASGSSRFVFRAVRDTLLPYYASARVPVNSISSVRPRPGEPSPTGEPLMRSARVRMLLLDSASRAELAAAGVRDSQPMAYLQAFTYGADCRPVAWRDTQPFIEPGERGYAVARLTPRSAWIDSTPLFVVTHPWAYPYPRRRDVLAALLPMPSNRASPEELFDFENTVIQLYPRSFDNTSDDSLRTARALTWARKHVETRDREPIRTDLRRTLMVSDMRQIERAPSRLRGTYRVTMQTHDTTLIWWFRTVDKPAYRWQENDDLMSTERMLAEPYASYSLVGFAVQDSTALARAGLASASTRDARLVWLATDDRPSLPGNDARRELRAQLTLQLKVVPQLHWPSVEPYNQALSAVDSALFVRIKRPLAREDRQPTLPMTVNIGRDGTPSADTTLVRDGRRLRVTIVRTDTISVVREW